jgi:hypothetical protein
VDEIVDDIKALSWVWSLYRFKIGAFIFMIDVGIHEIVCLGKRGMFVLCIFYLFCFAIS